MCGTDWLVPIISPRDFPILHLFMNKVTTRDKYTCSSSLKKIDYPPEVEWVGGRKAKLITESKLDPSDSSVVKLERFHHYWEICGEF